MKSSSSNSLKEQCLLNKRYVIKGFLVKGASSKVFKCLDTKTGLIKAAKIYLDDKRLEFEKEAKIISIISQLNSPYLIKYYESGIGLLTKNGNNSERKRYAILELGEHGELYEAIEKTKNGFSEDVCKYIFLQILNCVDALHKNGICHRDIKSENMVLCGDNHEIKLCDFGSSIQFLKNNQKKKLKKPFGTPYYKAPEILENKEYEGDKIDIFSMGALLFVLMTKNFAFVEAKSSGLYKFIKDKQYDDYWDTLKSLFNLNIESEKFKNLFLKMVAYNPEERPTIDEIKNDEWLKDVINATPEQLNYLRNKMISEINIV